MSDDRCLLMVMNPRLIDECVRSISALEVDKAWLIGYTEAQLEEAVPALVSDTDYDRYVIVSDDVVVTPRALEVVVEQGDGRPDVVTGWTNLDTTDEGLRMTSVTSAPFTAYESTAEQYRWTPMREVVRGAAVRRTWFAGMCLTSMSRDSWLRFPFGTFNGGGFSSDFDLSWRLQQAGVPVWALRDAGVFHVKECTSPWRLDAEPRKRLRLLGDQARTRLQPCAS
jgi:hypothetical protein